MVSALGSVFQRLLLLLDPAQLLSLLRQQHLTPASFAPTAVSKKKKKVTVVVDSEFKGRVPDFWACDFSGQRGFGIWGYGFKMQGFRLQLRVSGLKSQVSGPWLQISGFGFGFRVAGPNSRLSSSNLSDNDLESSLLVAKTQPVSVLGIAQPGLIEPIINRIAGIDRANNYGTKM
eukprot:3940868-Rhodomonas_salina.2